MWIAEHDKRKRRYRPLKGGKPQSDLKRTKDAGRQAPERYQLLSGRVSSAWWWHGGGEEQTHAAVEVLQSTAVLLYFR